jgi:hypothetical protein
MLTTCTCLALALNEQVVALRRRRRTGFPKLLERSMYAVQPSRSPETTVRCDTTLTTIFLDLR